MIDAAVAAYGRLDIPVNNAGVMYDMAPIAEEVQVYAGDVS